MEVISLESIWWIGLFMAVAAVYLATGKAWESSVVNRVRLYHKISTTTGISHSVKNPEVSKSTPYKHILPPQRRQALSELTTDKVQPVDEDDVLEKLMPMTLAYNVCQENMYTPTGISAQELRELKDFPDYTVLSGLPSPQPYHEFDINTALPRQYRPFRWLYHQTMCKSLSEKDLSVSTDRDLNSNIEDGERLVDRVRKYLQRKNRSAPDAIRPEREESTRLPSRLRPSVQRAYGACPAIYLC